MLLSARWRYHDSPSVIQYRLLDDVMLACCWNFRARKLTMETFSYIQANVIVIFYFVNNVAYDVIKNAMCFIYWKFIY